MKKYTISKLALASLFITTVVILSSFYNNSADKKDTISSHLSIKSESDIVQTFDLLVKGDSNTGDFVFIKEKSLTTPYELDLSQGDYDIIIHRTTQNGVVIGTLEGRRNGETRVSAESDNEVIFFTVNSSNNVSATGI